MDVPFHSSGAVSRAHYAIVRKVETASSVQTADQHIFLEINSVHAQLAHPRLSPSNCKEGLVILLYCATSVTPGFLANDAFDFAFTHAINLAEAGGKTEDKRIGYLFCSEMMPMDHELRLMLVNTLRKDLESDDIPRICLALDNLIASPSEDVIPAVQSRLHDLLSHDYPNVKRRALFAFRALSVHDPALLERAQYTVVRRLKDSDDAVVKAALALLADHPPQDDAMRSKAKGKVNEILDTEASYINDLNAGIILQALKAIRTLGLLDQNIPILLEVLRDHSHPKVKKALSKAVVLDIFKSLSDLPSLISTEDSNKISMVESIRHLLASQKPNDNYLFMSCLAYINVANWAGTSPDRPAVLEVDEFERIMQLLTSPDQATSRKTIRVVNSVDPAILDMQTSLIMQMALKDSADPRVVSTLLDIILIRHAQDGGKYATSVLELIAHAEKTSKKPQVLREIVGAVLTDLRTSKTAHFTTSAAAHFVEVLLDPEVTLGPTALVIATALTTEYTGSLTTPSSQILSGIASRLKTCPSIVQEPCLIAMLRARAECDDVAPDVIESVTELSKSARQPIRARCNQFLEFSRKKEELVQVVRQAASSSLPDFLVALQQHTGEEIRSSASSPHFSRPISRSSRPGSSLKYAAYAAPQVGPRLRTRRMSSSGQSVSSSHTASQVGSPPMTAGQLALVSGLEDVHIHDHERLPPTKTDATLIDLQASRTDLITLDSPFHAEPLAESAPFEIAEDKDFGDIWHELENLEDSCDLRGWCKNSIATITRRLQRFDDRQRLRVVAADVPPFEGELKILMISDEKGANAIALRLRESDEDSCLWRLRCGDGVIGAKVQYILDS